MRRTYEYLFDSYYETENDTIEKRNFLNKINSYVNQKQYVRLTLLNWNEEPLKEIQGELTSGTLTKDGSSSVRRTCTFSASFDRENYNIDDADYDFALNKKIFVEIGVKNYTGEYLQYPILWFPQGVFFIGATSASSSSSGAVQIQLTLKDKMCGLNGVVGGTFPATVILDEEDTQDTTGAYVSQKVLISEIIREMVVHYGGEDINNIVIEDVPARIKRIVKWTGSQPLYLVKQTDKDGSAGSTWYNATLDKPTDESALYETYVGGSDVGYVYDDFVYDDELTANLGETVTTVLDKLKSYLGNFEYFYDEFGIFHFREVKNYLNTTQATTLLNNMSKADYLVETTASKSVYTFEDKKNITNISVNPSYDNIKNDFVIQGQTTATSASAASYVRYHLVIDKKPTPLGTKNRTFKPKETTNYYNTYYRLLFYKEESTGLTKPCFVDNTTTVGINSTELTNKLNDELSQQVESLSSAFQETWENESTSLEDKKTASSVLIENLTALADEDSDNGLSVTSKSAINDFVSAYNGIKFNSFKRTSQAEQVFYELQNAWGTLNVGSTAVDLTLDAAGKILLSWDNYFTQVNETGYTNGWTELGKENLQDIVSGYKGVQSTLNALEDFYTNSDNAPFVSSYKTFAAKALTILNIFLNSNFTEAEKEDSAATLILEVGALIEEASSANTYRIEEAQLIKTFKIELAGWAEAFKKYFTMVNNREEQEDLDSQEYAATHNAVDSLLSSLTSISITVDVSQVYDDFLPEVGDFNVIYVGFNASTSGINNGDVDLNSTPLFAKYWDATSNKYKDVEIISYFNGTQEGGYQAEDWRTELYLEGLMAKNLGIDGGNYYSKINNVNDNAGDILQYAHNSRIDTDYYYEELDAFWPQIYDMATQSFIAESTEESLQTAAMADGIYYLDFIDPSTSGLGQFSVSNIGRRTDAVSSEDVNCLFQPEIPNIVFINIDNSSKLSDEDFNTQLAALRTECVENDIPYTQVTSDIWNALATGGSKNGAFDQVKYELYLHTTYQKSISLGTVPIYYLEPNTRVEINDATTNTYGDYNINSLSIPLGSGGTMSLSLSQASERF